MKNFNLKELFENKTYGWNKGFKFEIIFSNSGVARIYIGDRKTEYSAGGYGYEKTSAVIAKMINDLIGSQNYSPETYGNMDGLLSPGTSFEAIQRSFESIQGNKLDQIYSGKNSNIYQITFGGL